MSALLGIFILFIMQAPMTKMHDLINKNYNIKNLLTLSMTGTVVIFFLFYHFFDYSNLKFDFSDFDFMTEPFVWFVLAVNLLSHLTTRLGMKANEKSMGAFNFIGFAIMALVPLISYAVYKMGLMENAINIEYESIYELIGLTLILIAISLFYFKGKLNLNEVSRPDLLILCTLVSTFANVLVIKSMQTYNTEAFYFMTILFNSAFWILGAAKGGEHKYLSGSWWMIFMGGIVYIWYSQLNVYLVSLLAVEFLVVFRLVITILVASTYDYFNNQKYPISKKDFLLLILLLLIVYIKTFYS